MLKPKTHVKHHHVFIMVFLVISVFFAGNVIALNMIHGQVTSSALSEGTTPIILARNEEIKLEEENKDPKQEEENILAPLRDVIKNNVDQHSVDMGVAVQNLNTGDYIGVNDKLLFKSASLYKLFVGFEILREIDKGTYSLNDTHNGTTIDACMHKMITVSDNSCGRSLRALIGADSTTPADIIDLGYTDTNLTGNYPVSSTRDVAKLYDDLYNQRHLKANTNKYYLDTLKRQTVNDRIPEGLPANTVVAHKTGDLEGFTHDAGIIYTDYGDFSISIMSGPWPNGYSDAPPAIVSLVEEIYAWLIENS